ncbi:MAG: adenylate/guanylate cyclase domain-containing protein [Planctomycetota bacterium]|jgi:class 3 adenylate cyclase
MDDLAKSSPPPGAAADRPLRAMTLVFTDLQDSTGLKQRLGDPAAVRLIERHRRHVYDLVAAAGDGHGRIVNCAGDGFLLTFGAPSAALRFALGLQQAHADDRVLPAVRIGIHQGEVGLGDDGSELDGVEVDTAARLGALALPGQVLLSIGALRSAKAHVRADARGRPICWRVHGDFRLRGLQEPVTVGEAGIDGISPLAPPPGSSPAAAGRRRRYMPAGRPLAVAASVAVLVLGLLVPYLIMRHEADPDAPFQEIAASAAPNAGPKAPAVVHLRPEWGRAGHPGQTFARPALLGADDYLNLHVTADQPGHLYVFRVRPDGTTRFQPPDHRDDSGACTALACAAGQELLFGTYHLDDPPGRYCFVAILAREPIPDICDHLGEHLAPAVAGRGAEAAVGGVLEAFERGARIIGHSHFSYRVGGM